MAVVVNDNVNDCIYKFKFAFAGFSAYGKFGDEHGNTSFHFKETSMKKSSMSNKVLLADGGIFMAFAFDKYLCLKGLIESSPNVTIEIIAPQKIRQLVANESYALVLLENGKVYKCLPNFKENFVEIKFELSETYKKLQKRDNFGRLKILEQQTTAEITQIGLGDHIAVAISSTNEVFNLPSKIYEFPFKTPVKTLQCGSEHALLLNLNGDVYSWGIGLRGQLGHGCPGSWEKPKLINALAGIKIKSIAASGWHSAAISVFDDVYIWGFNTNGQTAQIIQNRQSVYPLPQLVELPVCRCKITNAMDNKTENETKKKTEALKYVDDLPECFPVDISTGHRHTILRMSCGSLYGCGWNAFGQLGFVCDSDVNSNAINNIDQFKKIELNNSNYMTDNVEIICGRWSTIVIPQGLESSENNTNL